MSRIVYVCVDCGSEDIVADSASRWNYLTQQWETTTVYDKGHFCNACDDECKIEAKELK